MSDTKMPSRQRHILVLLERGPRSRAQIAAGLFPAEPASKVTIIRDLHALMERGLVLMEGKGRARRYELAERHPLLAYGDLTAYFSLGPDERDVRFPRCDPAVFDAMSNLLTVAERGELDAMNRKFARVLRRGSDPAFQRELERFVIELSWKSSQIEGNTYSLLETEVLVKRHSEAPGRSREEATMILNHKRAFDAILKNRARFRTLSLADLRALHALLTKGLSIDQGIRTKPVGITGTLYVPPDNRYQTEDALRAMLRAANRAQHPAEKALIALVGLAYIQPFTDGNKRLSRMTCNALLLAHGFSPLSYRSIDDVAYKQALILFFEQHSLYHIKRLFLDQCRFAARTYFREHGIIHTTGG